MPIPTVKPSLSRAAKPSRLEIMLVVSVLAVLLSLLLVRLSELNGKVRALRLQTAAATVRAAASLFHARCVALRQRQAHCDSVALDEVPVAGVNDYPAATPEGIGRAAPLPPSASDPFRLRPRTAHGLPALSFSLREDGCEFLYVQAASPDAFPEVDIVDATCH